MKEKTKRKIVGNWLYSIYRRMRYVRYLNKLKKEKRQQKKLDDIEEARSFQLNIIEKKRTDIKDDKQKRKQLKYDLKQEKKEIKRKIIEKNREDQLLERRKNEAERKEQLELKAEMKRSMRSQGREEKRLERKKLRNERNDLKLEQEEIKKRLKEKITSDKEEKIDQRKRKIDLKIAYKRKKRRLRPYLVRRRFREIFRGIFSINRFTFKRWLFWIRDVRRNPADRINFVKILINSTFLFVLSYLTLYILGQAITILVASTFEFDTILFYFKIFYNIDSKEWSGDSVKILYSIKPFIGLILGTISLIIYSSLQNSSSIFKLYFLWNFVNGMVMFFGSILLGTLLNQGFGWVIAYLYYKDTGKMIFSIISIFALVVAGVSISRSFLISGNAYFNSITSNNKKVVALSQVLFPSILGTVILAFLKIPEEYYFTTTEEVIYEILKLSSVLIIIISSILSFTSFTDIFFDEEPRKPKIGWLFLLITAVIFVTYFLLFREGVPFNVSVE
ncbi:MAG: hypothetical protein K8S16_16585 [Bacteroidales bacterium]|nr:hypothetical protein [Bacteroidales bacterium]